MTTAYNARGAAKFPWVDPEKPRAPPEIAREAATGRGKPTLELNAVQSHPNTLMTPDPLHSLLFAWGERQRAALRLTGWHRRVPLTKLIRGEPPAGGFHSQLPRGVEFSRPEDLDAVARVQEAMDTLRGQNEPAWLAVALFAVLPAPYLSDSDRARIARVDLAAYRGLLGAGLAALRGRLFLVADGGLIPKRRRERG